MTLGICDPELGATLCPELAEWRSGKGVDRVWGRDARRDRLRGSRSRVETDQRRERRGQDRPIPSRPGK